MFVHGNNIEQKANHKTKYQDELSKKYLKEIREEYQKWKSFNEELKGPCVKSDKKDRKIIDNRTSALNQYKDFIDQQHYAEHFDSRSKVVAEWLKLTDSVNLKKFKIDQIYVLRKQKNTDREFRFEEGYVKNPIYQDVVEHLFEKIRDFLTSDWKSGIDFGLEKGYLI